MRMRSLISWVLGAGCILAVSGPARGWAITDEEFNALKEMVTKQGERLQQLEKAHEQDLKTIEENRKLREQDQQQIRQLQQQLGVTQEAATNAAQKAEAAAQVQPVRPVPGEGNATHNFTMVGDAEVQFGKVDGKHSGFVLADFAPIFLFRGGDRILFEAGFDITLQNNATGGGSSTSIGLSFAQLDYLFNDYVTFVGGDMLLPLGTYSERAAGWLNKIPDDPLPRDLVPPSGVGAQLRGAFPVGQSGQYLSYSAYGVNGPSSIDGSGTSTNLDLENNVGLNSDGDFIGNLHGSPAGGGRVAYFLPWKAHYDVELGLSGQSGPWDNAGNRLWSAGVVDAALHVSPYLEVRGEYIYSWVQSDDVGTFHPRGWWIQAAYKLAGLGLEVPVVNNLELVGRYDLSRNGLGIKTDRYTLGYIYYFSNSLLFEGDYEFVSSNDPDSDHNRLVFQLAYGF